MGITPDTAGLVTGTPVDPGGVKRSRGDAPVAAAASAPPSLRLTLTLRPLDFAALVSVPCCALAPPLVMSLVGEAPEVVGCRPQICVRQGFGCRPQIRGGDEGFSGSS